MIPWWKVEFGEDSAQAAHDAVAGRRMTMGPLTAEFERRFAELLDVPFVVSTSSGTAALTLALLAAGVGPGDDVVVPNRTWIATAHAPKLLGANVVLVDVLPDRPVMSPEAFAAAITPRTKVALPVHLNGYLADIDRIRDIAARHGVTVIEDACQALFSHFSDGRTAGTKSFAGCYSFSIGKPLSCGQGGAVATSDPDTARRLVLARTHGASNVTMAQWEMLGGNFRFWDLPASVILTQLNRIDEVKASIARVYEQYEDGLRSVKSLRFLSDSFVAGEIPIYAECLCHRRDELIQYLAQKDIQARPYYANINSAPQFLAANPGSYPNSDIFAEQCLVMPCGPDMEPEAVERVISTIKEFDCI